MPFTIHEEAARKQINLIISRPQEQVPDPLPENFQSTVGQGLPVKQIPHYDFPKCVYMHPNEPYETVEHRNAKHELVDTELVPTEALSKVIGCEKHMARGGTKDCPDCNRLLDAALAEGWVREPYIPKPEPPKNSGLYGPKRKAAAK